MTFVVPNGPRLWLAALVFLPLGSAAPVAWAEEARSSNVLNAAGEAETPYFVQQADAAGPTVMVVGGMHGNEPAGAYAADQIRYWPIRRGALVVVPRANPPALEANKRYTPGAEEAEKNLNRNFPRSGKKEPPRGAMAAALWDLVEKFEPDWVVDLHEGYDFHQINDDSVGSSVIAARDDESRAMAELLLSRINPTIPDDRKDFVRLGPPVDGSLARAAAEHLGCRSLILETTSREQPLPLRARQHRLLMHTLLGRLGMLDEALTPDSLVTSLTPPDVKHIAVFQDAGVTGRGVPQLEKLLGGRADVRLIQLCGEDIRAGMLDQFHVTIFSGGSGSRQAASLGEEGREKVRQFVDEGGVYVGICAGSYLACNGFSWGLKVLDARTASSRWRRGAGQVEVELTDLGRSVLQGGDAPFSIRYVNGPILVPDQAEAIPDFEVLARFRSELAENDTPPGVMIHSPAIVAGNFGQGRVICFSPHPEQSPGCEGFVWEAIQSQLSGQVIIENTLK
jgi:predicted deacylase/glutamine amidotransferase-like uncharacterized protein